MTWHRGLSTTLFAVFATSAAVAQIAADLQGRVVDGSGAVVGHATVVLIEEATSFRQQTTTSASGEYGFTHLNPGSYRIDVTAPGFERLSRTGLTATVGQTASVDLELTIGAEQQSVLGECGCATAAGCGE